ncbi:MAG: hypothetical protein L6290_02785 [Thermodesulfovibrionales bacterium]|nr:hypothetical protein [Thermodesulfovibrionales bacterium]
MSKSRYYSGILAILVLIIGIFSVGCATVGGPPGQMSEASREALLKERVMKMWEAQVTGDRATMYDMYDPFFRARVKKGLFADKDTSYISYYNPMVESVDIKGNVAHVRVKMEYEVKGLDMPGGGKYDEPRKENITNETWLFIDGTWYRQFIDYITEAAFAKY